MYAIDYAYNSYLILLLGIYVQHQLLQGRVNLNFYMKSVRFI